jgi:uncharacterized protein (UPF0276 family)
MFAGIGLGLRRAFARDLVQTTRQVDWIEIDPASSLQLGTSPLRDLRRCLERWVIVPHSSALSVGGVEPLSESYLEAMRQVCRQLDPPFLSDHLGFSRLGGVETHDVLPLPFTEEAVRHIVGRIREVEERLEVPLVLENPAYYAVMPGSDMSEADFVRTVVEEANCGLLLDVNNVFVNAVNHGYDPIRYIERMPLDRVRQIHLAGHTLCRDIVVDSHSGPIAPIVLKLYEYTLASCGRFVPTLVEWDQDVPSLDVVLDEVDRVRRHAQLALRARRAA